MERIRPFSETILCKLMAKSEDAFGYTRYVFKNLVTGSFEMITRLPNWDLPYIEIGDVGFVNYMEAVAGEDTWYDADNDKFVKYRADGSYMVSWVRSGKIAKKEEDNGRRWIPELGSWI